MLPMIFRAPLGGSEGGGGGGELFVQAVEGQVVLPVDFNPADAVFEHVGPDLLLTAPDGAQVLVADFYMMEDPPALLGTLGARVSGELAARLAGSATPGQVAGEMPAPDASIGHVAELSGEVMVIRSDGTRVTLQSGDSVFQGDILETESGAGIGIVLADGAALSMGEDARMVLDEMVYDPGTQAGSIALSVMKGIFTIVSGEVSKTDPDAMTISTPVATIGIRGTQIGLDLSNGRDLNLVMMEEADGFVGEVMIVNDGGAITLNQAYFAVTVGGFNMPPVTSTAFTPESVVHTFGGTLSYLPMQNENANDYGSRESRAEGLNAFETAAGEPADTDQGLASFEAAPAEREPEPEPDLEGVGVDGIGVDGMAGIELPTDQDLGLVDEGATEVPLDEFVTSTGQGFMPSDEGITAAALAGEADAVFGDDVSPLEPADAAELPTSEETSFTAPTPEPTPKPTAEPMPEPVPELVPEAINAPPVAEAGSVMTAEDNVFSGQLSASDLEGGALSFALAGDGGPANGTVTVNPDGTFTYIPSQDFSGNDSFTYFVTDNAGATAQATVNVTITPVADVPQLAVADASGGEDSAIALTLATSMSSDTGETVSSILLSGVPGGASLSAGTDNGDGTWSLLPGDLEGLTLTPPTDYSGTFTVAVSTLSSDGGVTTGSFGVSVNPIGDTPVVAAADVTGVEDGAIALTLAASMPAGTRETVDYLTVTGVPDGAVLSAGADNGDGTWTLSPDQLTYLTLTPPTDYSGTLNLGVVATSTDGATTSNSFAITVEPLADIPQLAVADAVGAEDGTIALTLAASMPADTTEAVYTITIEGVPFGATLSAGMDNGDGTWTLTPDLIDGLTLTPPLDYAGTFALNVVAISTDGGAVADTIGVTVTPIMDTPVIAVSNVAGAEDSPIALTVAASMPASTTETLDSIVLSGVPDGASLSAGTDNGDGSWSLSPDQLAGLTLTPPTNFSGSIELSVTAISSDGGTGSSTFYAAVTPVADAPTLQVSDVVVTLEGQPGEVIEGTPRADVIFGTMGDDQITGGSGADVIYGDGAIGSADGDDDHDDHDEQGHGQGRGQGHDEHGQGYGYGHDDDGDSGAGDDAGDDSGDSAGEPVIVALDVNAALTDVDGSEALSIEVSGVPGGAVLSVGTDNGDGTWTLLGDDLSDLDNLTLTLPQGSALDDFELGVTANSSELETGEAATTSATIDVTFQSGAGGNDYIDGGAGSDEIYGGVGDDVIVGAEGSDELYGEAGNDALVGGVGADLLDGGAGDDTLSGGVGADEFVFRAGDGDDIVLDLGHQDVLRFEGQEFNMDDFTLQSDAASESSTITFGDDTGVSVTLNDVDVQDASSYTVTQDGDAVVVTFDKDSID